MAWWVAWEATVGRGQHGRCGRLRLGCGTLLSGAVETEFIRQCEMWLGR